MREPERQKWIHGGKAGRKENDINRKCRERIHDKIRFAVVVVVCLFSFKFHRLSWVTETESSDPHPNPYISKVMQNAAVARSISSRGWVTCG